MTGRVVRKPLRVDLRPGACPICGGDGYVRLAEVWEGEPTPEATIIPQMVELRDGTEARLAGYTSVAWCSCKRRADRATTEKKNLDALSPRGLEQVWETWNASRTDLVQVRPPPERALIGAMDLVSWLPKDDGRGLLLFGALGVGKTHVLNAIAHRCISHGVAAIVVNLVTLMENEKRTMDIPGSRHPVDDAIAAPVLCLDELGANRLTSWVAESLFRLVDERMQAKRPTIWATNLSQALWEDYWASPRVPDAEVAHARMNAQRIARRITDGCERVFRLEKRSRR